MLQDKTGDVGRRHMPARLSNQAEQRENGLWEHDTCQSGVDKRKKENHLNHNQI